MRKLQPSEIRCVVGGLVAVESGTGPGGSTSSGQSNVLDNYTVNQYIHDSPLMSSEVLKLQNANWSFIYKDGATGGSVTDATHATIDITTSDVGNVGDTISQLSHELGHALHQMDEAYKDFSTAQLYANEQMLGEGYAQINAIRIVQELNAHGVSVNVPGDAAHVAQEIQTYNAMTAKHATDAQIAAALGDIMKTQVLKNGQTYEQFWEGSWNSAQPATTGSYGGSTGSGGMVGLYTGGSYPGGGYLIYGGGGYGGGTVTVGGTTYSSR